MTRILVTAARLVRHGEPLRVESLELPPPATGEVTVDMAFAGVNPVDRYGALGRVAPDGPLPRTLGTEGVGWVGGRPVVVRGHGLGTRRDGLWASGAVVPEVALIPVPEGVDLAAAAAMGVAGVTAWRTVHEKAAVRADDRVLVLGASGGVGSVIVSLVKSLGATVWAQTGNDTKSAFLRARGADRVVVADAASLRRDAAGLAPTVVFDPLGDGFFAAAVDLLEPRGRLVSFGTSADPEGLVPLQTLYRKALTVYGYAGLIESDEDTAARMREALDAMAGGRFEIAIDRVIPLERVNEAFELLVERRVQGKVVLDLRS